MICYFAMTRQRSRPSLPSRTRRLLPDLTPYGQTGEHAFVSSACDILLVQLEALHIAPLRSSRPLNDR